jgi:hypothetical protein
MHYDWFNEIEILQGRWQHGEKVGYCYHCGLEKTLCKWEIYVPLVTKGLTSWAMSQAEKVEAAVREGRRVGVNELAEISIVRSSFGVSVSARDG